MRIITWCLDGSGLDVRSRQEAWLKAQAPDLVALQDVPRDEHKGWSARFADMDLPYTLGSASEEGRKGVLIAGRWPLSPTARIAGAKERFLEVQVDAPKPFTAATARMPQGWRGAPKDIPFLRALNDRRDAMEAPALFFGMLATPATEHDTGESLIPVPFHRGDEGDEELRAMTLPGWQDAYRLALPRVDRHRDESVRQKGRFPRRLDHLHVLGDWKVHSARFDHGTIESGLGDHAPLVVEADLRGKGHAMVQKARSRVQIL